MDGVENDKSLLYLNDQCIFPSLLLNCFQYIHELLPKNFSNNIESGKESKLVKNIPILLGSLIAISLIVCGYLAFFNKATNNFSSNQQSIIPSCAIQFLENTGGRRDVESILSANIGINELDLNNYFTDPWGINRISVNISNSASVTVISIYNLLTLQKTNKTLPEEVFVALPGDVTSLQGLARYKDGDNVIIQATFAAVNCSETDARRVRDLIVLVLNGETQGMNNHDINFLVGIIESIPSEFQISQISELELRLALQGQLAAGNYVSDAYSMYLGTGRTITPTTIP